MSKLIKNRSGSLITDIFYSSTSEGTVGGAQYLNDLLDVIAQSPGSGDVLRFNAETGTWESTPASSIATPPGGLNGQFQFNDNGVLGGSPDLVYDKTARTIEASPVYFALTNPDRGSHLVSRVFNTDVQFLITPTLSDVVFGRIDSVGGSTVTPYFRLVNGGEGVSINNASVNGLLSLKTSTSTAYNSRAISVTDASNTLQFSVLNTGRIFGRELYIHKAASSDTSPPYNSNVVVMGDGQNSMAFFNDLGTSSDGYKIIAMFSRHAPAPGNAGFYSGYYVSGGNISHTFLFAPGARDFGISVYNGGNGLENPAIYIKDSTNYVGIGTKNPIMPFTVETSSTTISRFSSLAGYANTQLIVQNLINTGRASFIIGQSVSANAGTLAYFHSNIIGPAGRAIELFIGIPPITSTTRRMVRITDTEIQLTSSDVVLQSGNPTVGDVLNLKYMHSRRIDSSPVIPKVAISTILKDNTTGISDFVISLNNTPDLTEVTPTSDYVISISSINRNVGVHTLSPVADVDIVGAIRAAQSTIPSYYAEGSRYYDTTFKIDMIQLGGITIPAKFDDIFQNLPNLKEFLSFVDTDKWFSTTLPDFAPNTTWSVTGSAPLYLSDSPYGWGQSVAFSDSPTGQQVTSSQITFNSTSNDFIVGFAVHHSPDAGVQTRRLIKLVTVNGDEFAITYTSGILTFEDLTNNTSQTIETFAYDDRLVILLEFDRSASIVRILTTKRTTGGSTTSSVEFSGANIANISSISLVIGATDGIEAMNMNVHMVFVAEVLPAFGYVEGVRAAKQLANKWLV